jgi:hypothetical protein
MTQSPLSAPSGLRPCYNDQTSSDITLCFGDNNKFYAHKIILQAVSGVWNRAFRSQLPTSTPNEYDIDEHADPIVYAMLRFVYGTPLDANPPEGPIEGRLNYLFGIFMIANEYQIPSLGEAVTERVVQLMQTCVIEEKTDRLFDFYEGTEFIGGRDKFGAIISRTAGLYINNNVEDKSLMNGVASAFSAHVEDFERLDRNLDIPSLIGKHDPFWGRMLQLYLPKLQYSK